MGRLEAAIEFASAKHEGQYRKGGAPYITHPVAVAKILKEKGFDEDYQIAGIFHDLLEDTDATEEEILRLGGPDVLEAVKAVTKEEGYMMGRYVSAILHNPMAKEVKAADRLHNLRCAVEAEESFRRKYIEETLEWYMDFCDEIPQAVADLEQTLKK